MNKKLLIALADAIREHNRIANYRASLNTDLPIGTMHHGETMTPFSADQIDALADFGHEQNPAFKRDRWIGYIAGECGPNGGSLPRR